MRPKVTSPFDPRRCEKCKYFIRHYVANKDKTEFSECGGGHCVECGMKNVKENQTCEAFESCNEDA